MIRCFGREGGRCPAVSTVDIELELFSFSAVHFRTIFYFWNIPNNFCLKIWGAVRNYRVSYVVYLFSTVCYPLASWTIEFYAA